MRDNILLQSCLCKHHKKVSPQHVNFYFFIEDSSGRKLLYKGRTNNSSETKAPRLGQRVNFDVGCFELGVTFCLDTFNPRTRLLKNGRAFAVGHLQPGDVVRLVRGRFATPVHAHERREAPPSVCHGGGASPGCRLCRHRSRRNANADQSISTQGKIS